MATTVANGYNPYITNYKNQILSMLNTKKEELKKVAGLAFGVYEYFFYQLNDISYSVGKSNSTFSPTALKYYTDAANKVIEEAKAEAARTTITEKVLGDMLQSAEQQTGKRFRIFHQYP